MSSPREIMRAKSKDHYAVNNAHDLKALSGGVAVITGGNTAPLSPASLCCASELCAELLAPRGRACAGASGIGFAMAERAVANGMHVAIGDIGVQFLPGALEKLAEPAAASGVRTFAGICDVTEEASVQAFADEVAAAFVRKKLFLFLCFFCC